jgi:molybdate transport system substrate-binding protein
MPYPMMRRSAVAALGVLCGCSAEPDRAPTVRIAVASSFSGVLDELAQEFEAASGIRVVASAGATGKLEAQIRHGAPFELLLAADAVRPARLEADGHAVAGTRFCYARGRLALRGQGVAVGDGAALLRGGRFTRLAIANPETAPYGAAALAVLRALRIDRAVETKLVIAESATQALLFVRSGGAELGFVPLALVRREPATRHWLVPEDLHAPIDQEAVLLRDGAASAEARAFLTFLRSADARRVIESHGYTVPDE